MSVLFEEVVVDTANDTTLGSKIGSCSHPANHWFSSACYLVSLPSEETGKTLRVIRYETLFFLVELLPLEEQRASFGPTNWYNHQGLSHM